MAGWIVCIFSTESSSIIGQCLVNMNILAPKIEALQMGTKQQNGELLENDSNSSNSISDIF
jgi:hypothetical protein